MPRGLFQPASRHMKSQVKTDMSSLSDKETIQPSTLTQRKAERRSWREKKIDRDHGHKAPCAEESYFVKRTSKWQAQFNEHKQEIAKNRDTLACGGGITHQECNCVVDALLMLYMLEDEHKFWLSNYGEE